MYDVSEKQIIKLLNFLNSSSNRVDEEQNCVCVVLKDNVSINFLTHTGELNVHAWLIQSLLSKSQIYLRNIVFFFRIMDLWLSGRAPLLLHFLSRPLRRAYLQNYAVCPSKDMIT